MRWIEHRRHSMREPGGVHLTAAGTALARRVGAQVGPFSRVETSPIPRAVETAIAMGWPGSATLPLLAGMSNAVDRELGPITSWSDYRNAILLSRAVAAYADRVARTLEELAERVPEGRQALIISHGGIVELSAVAAHPDTDWESVGETASYLDGVRLTYEGGACVGSAVLRAPRD